MALDPQAVAKLAETLVSQHAKDLQKNGRLGLVSRYLKGDHDLPYAPRGAKQEYRILAKKAITNWLPLVSDTYAKALFVDGYRAAKESDNAKPWDYWQKNRLDARQSIVHRSAVDFGIGHAVVLPGDDGPSIKCYSALRSGSFFDDDDDEWPRYGLIVKGKDIQGRMVYEVLDDEAVYTVTRSKTDKADVYALAGAPLLHDLGKCPVVRFRDRLDGEACGIVRPLITIQDRINEAVFALMIAIQYASFRQRWATGLAIPRDENPYLDAQGKGTNTDTGRPNPNYGNPIEPFSAAVDRLWVSDSPDAKFGDFAQTEVSGHIANYEGAVRTLAAIAQISPHVLMGDLVNLAADALAAINDSTYKRTEEFATLFGESWEQVLRLAAAADGDSGNAADDSAQVRWRDTEARSLAQTVDALGKMAQMLQVPFEGLWERIPGVTETDVRNWKAMTKSGDGMKALADALSANAEATTASQTLTTATPAAGTAA